MKRPKQNDLPEMNGPGVAPVKDKVLDKLGEELISLQDDMDEAKKGIKKCEGNILVRMIETKIRRYSVADKVMLLKIGKTKIKLASITESDGDASGDPENEP